MLDNFLNIEGVSVLDRTELSKINGQTCSIFVQGQGWTTQTFSVEEAQTYYDGGSGDGWWNLGGAVITGYCCASCHTFPNHPSHHTGDMGPMWA